jgi:hypothetical protein
MIKIKNAILQNDNSIHIKEIVFREDISIKPLFLNMEGRLGISVRYFSVLWMGYSDSGLTKPEQRVLSGTTV